MKIEIKDRFESRIILCGEYESIKDCLEKNRGANLRGADLRGANLVDANLRGANLRGANLVGADLRGANLRGANLVGVDLRGANLVGVDLRGADLRGAKEYVDSHSFFAEIIRREKVDRFTEKEWSCIGKIIVHTLCWGAIKKRFPKVAMSVFKKLSKAGFNEWELKFKGIKE